jgi:hypothetical protein
LDPDDVGKASVVEVCNVFYQTQHNLEVRCCRGSRMWFLNNRQMRYTT